MGNILVNGTAYAKTDRGGTTYAAAMATDGNLGTRWASNDNDVPTWWAYDLGVGVSKAAGSVSYYLASTELPNSFTIDCSNDNSHWTTVLTTTGLNSASTWLTYPIPVVIAARFWRMTVNSVWSGVVGSLSEIQMTETLIRPATPAVFGLPRGGR